MIAAAAIPDPDRNFPKTRGERLLMSIDAVGGVVPNTPGAVSPCSMKVFLPGPVSRRAGGNVVPVPKRNRWLPMLVSIR